jgi:hypothetical protein
MSRFRCLLITGFLTVFEPSCAISIGAGGSSHGHQSSFLGALFLFGFGLLLFYGGFQNYRKFRLLEDTPMVPIRSIPMGLVHVRGKAAGDERVVSPITRVPCFYFKVLVDQHSRDHKGGDRWSMRLRHVEKVNFYIEDATGKALVDSHQAQLDLPETFIAETGPQASKARTLDPSLGVAGGPSDAELLDYLVQTNAKVHAELATQHKSKFQALADMDHSVTFLPAEGSAETRELSAERLRFKESCILPDREYNVLGTCAENPNPKDEHDRNMILKGQNEPTFLISSRSEQGLEKQTRKGAFLLILIGGAMMIWAAAIFLFK